MNLSALIRHRGNGASAPLALDAPFKGTLSECCVGTIAFLLSLQPRIPKKWSIFVALLASSVTSVYFYCYGSAGD